MNRMLSAILPKRTSSCGVVMRRRLGRRRTSSSTARRPHSSWQKARSRERCPLPEFFLDLENAGQRVHEGLDATRVEVLVLSFTDQLERLLDGEGGLVAAPRRQRVED